MLIQHYDIKSSRYFLSIVTNPREKVSWKPPARLDGPTRRLQWRCSSRIWSSRSGSIGSTESKDTSRRRYQGERLTGSGCRRRSGGATARATSEVEGRRSCRAADTETKRRCVDLMRLAAASHEAWERFLLPWPEGGGFWSPSRLRTIKGKSNSDLRGDCTCE